MGEGGRPGRNLLAQTFYFSWDIGRAARECGAKQFYAVADKRIPFTNFQKEKDFDLTQVEGKKRHQRARDEYKLLVPFQCDLCHFRNLANRDPG